MECYFNTIVYENEFQNPQIIYKRLRFSTERSTLEGFVKLLFIDTVFIVFIHMIVKQFGLNFPPPNPLDPPDQEDQLDHPDQLDSPDPSSFFAEFFLFY
jgi:hypothetical protein